MKFKAAIIGLGSMGMRHLKIYQSLENVEVVAVCDINLDQIRDLGQSNKYTDYKDLLLKENLDILSVVTTGPHHAEIVKEAAQKKIPRILCEKPIATNIKDAKEMIRLCRENGVNLSINHSRRWSEGYLMVARAIKNKEIGEVRHIHTTLGGGRLGAMGTHIFDVWRMLANSDLKTTIGFIDQNHQGDHKGRDLYDPGGFGLIQLSNGARATIDISEDLGVPEHFVVTGSIGRIIIDEQKNTIKVSSRQGDDREKRLGEFGLPLQEKEIKFEEPLDIILFTKKAILELLENKKPSCTGEDGLKALEACLSFHLSYNHQNKLVPLPLNKKFENFNVRIS